MDRHLALVADVAGDHDVGLRRRLGTDQPVVGAGLDRQAIGIGVEARGDQRHQVDVVGDDLRRAGAPRRQRGDARAGGEVDHPLAAHRVGIVEQPARGIIDLQPGDKKVRLYTTDEHRQRAAELLQPLGQAPKVVLHPNRSWEIRTWPSERWRRLTQGLLEHGVQIVVVGSEVPNIGVSEQNIPKGVFDLGIEHPSLLDLTNQTSLHELREVIALCDLVITVDSGVLHVANCTDTDIVAIFTDIDPRFRTRIRDNKPNAGTKIVHSPCPKQFCQSWHSSTGECLQPGEKNMCCLPSVKQMLEAVMGFLRLNP